MAIDLEQFHQVFFEESLEGLDVMESALMELDPNAVDAETINAVFRSAHSIKGGSATFGFTAIAAFTHVLETFLDRVRDGRRQLLASDVDILLKSVDCLREMLSALEAGDDSRSCVADDIEKTISELLESDSLDTDAVRVEHGHSHDNTDNEAVSRWRIDFSAEPGLFLSGNDPVKLLESLSGLGAIHSIKCDDTHLPALASLNPEQLYLRWTLEIDTEANYEAIQEVFEWVEDQCELTIQQLAHQAACSSAARHWEIHFYPKPELLRSGNEPLRILRALESLGQVASICDVSALPALSELDSELCHLSWIIRLESLSCSHEDIEEIFEWVRDLGDIDIRALQELSTPEKNRALSRPEPLTELPSTVSPSTVLAATAVAVENTDAVKNTGFVEKSGPQGEAPVDVSARKTKTPPKAASENASIRVGTDKVDNLINMVGELVITQSMLGQLGNMQEFEGLPKLIEGLTQLEQNTRELQECVMKIRMLPLSFAFSRFPRMVRDLSQSLGKSVELLMVGENTELDKTVMEKIGDPLVHLVRNAVDHGIETPQQRLDQGKDPSGTIKLVAYHQGGNVVIEIIDDGRGLDREKILKKAVEKSLVNAADAAHLPDDQVYALIFQPGFSTANTVSDVSGRGVGMDVVRRNILALNGSIDLDSTLGKGSKITIKLPLTLAILDGQLVRVGRNTYVFPLVSIVESLQCRAELVNRVGSSGAVLKLRGDYVPIIELHKAFDIAADSDSLLDSLLVVVDFNGSSVGIVVDELLAQQQVVIKSLEQNYRRVEGVSGATILGDGTVALILDIGGIIKLYSEKNGVAVQTLGTAISAKEKSVQKILRSSLAG